MYHLQPITDFPPPLTGKDTSLSSKHPNIARLESTVSKLPSSKRAAYLETAYVRTVKGLGDDTLDNYYPADQLANLLSEFMPESEKKYRCIMYLKCLSDAESSNIDGRAGDNHNEVRKNTQKIISAQRDAIKRLHNNNRANFF